MSAFQRFDAWGALDTIAPSDAAKAAKPAKVEPGRQHFSEFSDFSSAVEVRANSPTALDTAEERRAWADDLCRRLHRGVAYQSPAGLGRWAPAWRMVAAPSERLLDLLAEYERTGNVADKLAAEHAAGDVAFAWERAAKAWERHLVDGRHA